MTPPAHMLDTGTTLSFILYTAMPTPTLYTLSLHDALPIYAAYQHLAQGVTTNVVAHYTVTDEHGAHDSSTLTITVTGTNDAPVRSEEHTSELQSPYELACRLLLEKSNVNDGATLSYALDEA